MKQHFKLYFVVSVMAVLLSAWAVQTAQSASDPNGGTSVESSQDTQLIESNNGSISGDVSTTGIPSLEDRTNMLNGVNLSPSIIKDATTTGNIEGPMPGTETRVGDTIIPLPAPSSINGSPDVVGPTSENIISSSIKLISDWLSALLKSIFNS